MNIILALLAAFFLTMLLSVYLQHCYLRRNLGAAAIMPYYHRPRSPPHGLDSGILQTLPKVIFSSSATATATIAQQKTQSECVICLEEFKDGQTLQVLPQCDHCFHPECIHMWLFSHMNCPLCRHSLLIPLKPSPTSSSTSAPTQPPPPVPLQVQSSAAPSLP